MVDRVEPLGQLPDAGLVGELDLVGGDAGIVVVGGERLLVAAGDDDRAGGGPDGERGRAGDAAAAADDQDAAAGQRSSHGMSRSWREAGRGVAVAEDLVGGRGRGRSRAGSQSGGERQRALVDVLAR